MIKVKMQVRFKIGNSNEERTTRPFVINKEGISYMALNPDMFIAWLSI